TFTTSALAPGTRAITASFRGDSSSLGSTSPALTLIVGSRNQRFVEKVYLDLLHRDVDPLGVSYWAALLDGGASSTQVVRGLQGSEEYRIDLVQSLYQQFLRRAADPVGLSAWVGALATGTTVEQIEAGLIGSVEYFQRFGSGTNDGFLQSLYQDVLHRSLEAG